MSCQSDGGVLFIFLGQQARVLLKTKVVLIGAIFDHKKCVVKIKYVASGGPRDYRITSGSLFLGKFDLLLKPYFHFIKSLFKYLFGHEWTHPQDMIVDDVSYQVDVCSSML